MLQDLVMSNLVGGRQGVGLSHSLFFYLCFCPLFSHLLFHFLSEKRMIDFMCFFVYLFSLPQVPLTRNYSGTEIVVSLM